VLKPGNNSQRLFQLVAVGIGPPRGQLPVDDNGFLDRGQRVFPPTQLPRAAPSAARTSGPASEAHCPIAANDRDPAITAAIPVASSPASAWRCPRLFRGSGTWARRSSRYWLRAAGISEDVIGGRASLVADDG
jgi:hypothetical protein